MPDLSLEAIYAAQIGVSLRAVCGIDEAGRGPWAGPVAAAAVILDPDDVPEGIDDSKRLTEAARDGLAQAIRNRARAYACIMIGPDEIDQTNILAATLKAMRLAVEALPITPELALVDGNKTPDLNMACQAIVGGDHKSLSIAAASILAKVARDQQMQAADALYPGYGFAQHKGYGTKAHAEALQKLGPCPVHRLSYKPVAAALQRFQQ
jgi:ribonuclease HII